MNHHLKQKAPFLLLVLSHFLVDLYASFLAPLQPYLIARHHLTLTQAGFLVSLYAVSASLLQPLYGYLADLWKKRYFVVFGPLLAAVFMSVLNLVPGYGMMMACLFLGGIGVAAFHPQGSSLSHAHSGRRKGLGMSLFISGGNIGAALGPVAIMSLFQVAGQGRSYLAAIPGVLLSMTLLFFCRDDLPEVIGKTGRNGASAVGQLREHARPLAFLYGLIVFRTVVHTSFVTYVPVLLQKMGAGPMAIGTAVTGFMGLGAVGGIMGGMLYDRIGGRNIFIASSLLAPVFLAVSLRMHSFAAMIVFFALAGFVLVMTVPVGLLMGQSIVPGAISTVSSLMMGFGWGMGGLMVPAIGKLADITSLSLALSVLALVPLLYLPLAVALPKGRAQEIASN